MIEKSLRFYDLEKDRVINDSVRIREPRKCMHCMNTGTQVYIDGVATMGVHDETQGICIFSCPLCGSSTVHFLAISKELIAGDFEPVHIMVPVHSIPNEIDGLTKINSIIKEKFPDFVKIYEQSQVAESHNLNQIAGMGYRKSLEFLVTDFLIEFPVEGVEETWLTSPTTMLGQKISKLKNERLKNLAKAISFIGNDETHYTRRHPEHDTESIKIFLDTLLSEIQNEITYLEAEKLLKK